MKKDDDTAISCGLLLITLPFSTIWSGYVLSLLWQWFITATFEIPSLSMPAAIGLALVVRYLTYQTQPTDKSKTNTERTAEWIFTAAFWPAFALVFGFIVKSFM